MLPFHRGVPALSVLICAISWAAAAAAAGTALAGEEIAIKGGNGAAACSSCHGDKGQGLAAAGFPRLAGLHSEYLQAQLQAFRDGARSSTVMAPIAEALDIETSKTIADYYAGQGVLGFPVPPVAASDAQKLAVGRDLARYGDWEGRHLPACVQCHGPAGRGAGATFPPLAGQGAVYISAQLKAWQQGERKGDPLQLMKVVADKLTAAEIDAVAAWYGASAAGGPVRDELMNVVADLKPTDSHALKPAPGGFSPPPRSTYPEGEFGESVRRGEAIFTATNRHPASAEFVGNDQQCGNCHVGEGRLPHAAPMWASWVAYPAYRGKNKKVNTFIERVQGCFDYSMNAQASKQGHAPPADSEAIVDLNSYFFWLSKGAPTGDSAMPGRGFPKLADTDQGFDPERGAVIYAAKCQLCHGADGKGLKVGGGVVFPPLWGSMSYNWGAGMHNINKAAGFIKANMPLGQPNSLSDQQAWDVAAYINSFDRPQDPRFTGDLAETTARFHGKKYDYYGKRNGADGRLLGAVSPQGGK